MSSSHKDSYSLPQLVESYNKTPETHSLNAHNNPCDEWLPCIPGSDEEDSGKLLAIEEDLEEVEYCWINNVWMHEDSYTLLKLLQTSTESNPTDNCDLERFPALAENEGEDPLDDSDNESYLEPNGYDDYTCTHESWLRRNPTGLRKRFLVRSRSREWMKADLQALYTLHWHLKINIALVSEHGSQALCTPQPLSKNTYKSPTELNRAQCCFAQHHIGISEILRSASLDLVGACAQTPFRYNTERNYFAHQFGRPFAGRFPGDAATFTSDYESFQGLVAENIVLLENHLDDECVWKKPAPLPLPQSTSTGISMDYTPWNVSQDGWGEETEAATGCLPGLLAWGSRVGLRWGQPEGNSQDDGWDALREAQEPSDSVPTASPPTSLSSIFASCRRLKVVRSGLDFLEGQLQHARQQDDDRQKSD